MSDNNLYSKAAKTLHWLIAALIFLEYFIGITLDATHLKWLHIQLGCFLLILVIVRVIWRISHQYPDFPSQITGINKLLAKIGHLILYFLMLAIPLTGLVLIITKGVTINIFGIDIPPLMKAMAKPERHIIKSVHWYLATMIFYFAVFHGLIAFMHEFLNKIPSLSRMLPECLAKYIRDSK